jgi:hypothetical protein
MAHDIVTLIYVVVAFGAPSYIIDYIHYILKK